MESGIFNSRCHCVIENDPHASGVNLVDSGLPHCQVAKVLVKERQIERLAVSVSKTLAVLVGIIFMKATYRVSICTPWLIDKWRSSKVETLRFSLAKKRTVG